MNKSIRSFEVKLNNMRLHSPYMIISYIFIVLLIIIVILLVYLSLQKDIYSKSNNYDLNNDGIIVIKNVLNIDDINKFVEYSQKAQSGAGDVSRMSLGWTPETRVVGVHGSNNNNSMKESKEYNKLKHDIINNKNIQKIIQNKLGNDYQFHDYIFIIKKSSIHTCHRDANGDFFNDIKHPSYTMLIYLEDMEKCLGVIPKSHIDPNSFGINLTNKVENILCSKGDVLLFNANLIHTGTINKLNNKLRIQMKVSHKDDISKLSYYSNYNKILKEENNVIYPIKKISQNLSCMFPIISNYTQNDIKKSKDIHDSSDIPLSQKIFSYIIYGKKDYYNLPDAF